MGKKEVDGRVIKKLMFKKESCSTNSKLLDMKPNKDLDSLPVEIKCQILQFLPVRDVKSVIKLNRGWRQLCQDPGLWRNLHLNITSRSGLFIKDILHLSHLQQLRCINFDQQIFAKKAEETLRLIINHGSIEELDVSKSKLSDVSNGTLRTLMRKMKKLSVRNCRFTGPQLNDMFKVFSDDETNLEHLNIGNNNLIVDSDYLRKAVIKLTTFHCDNCNLVTSQISEMLTELRDSDCKLEDLNIMLNPMIHIRHQLLAESLSKLVSVNLWGCDAITISLLDNIISSNSINLQHLNLGNHDLTFFAAPLVADSLIRLVSVTLSECEMTPMQVTMLFTNIATKDNISLRRLEILGVDPPLDDLVKKAEEKLDKLEILKHFY